MWLFDYVLHFFKQHHPLAEIWELEVEVHTVISKAVHVLFARQVFLVKLHKLRSRKVCKF